MATEKIALVAVHGVADQLPGATARAVVDLLVASSSEAGYRSLGSRDLTLAVPPLRPHIEPDRRGDVSPSAADRSPFKAFLQSYRSDFQRQHWETPSAAEALSDMKAAKATAASASAGSPDRGLAFTDYLLGKQHDNGGLQEAYETTCIELDRAVAGKTERVDVYEMYWADLSRLSGAIPRILTEFGTLIFRLSRLGRDTVDEARGTIRRQGSEPTSWTLLTATQPGIDWLFVNVLAQLFFHLLLFGTVLVVLGFAKPVVPEHPVHLGVAIVLIVVGVLMLVYRRGGTLVSKALPAAMLVLAAISLLAPGHEVAVTGLVLVVVLTAAYDAVLRVADERFPFTRYVGLAIWLVLLATVVLHLLTPLLSAAASLDTWRRAALYGTELTLLAIKAFWIAISPMLLLWIASGLFAQHGSYERKASVSTGRLGLGVSMCAFVVMTMAVWALLTNVVDLSLRGVSYVPELFPAIAAPEGKSTAQAYLQQRYLGSTETFAPLAILLLTLLAFAIVTLFPSVLAELEVIRNKDREAAGARPAQTAGGAKRAQARQRRYGTAAQRLGRWLTAGYRKTDALMLLICGAGVVMSVAVLMVFAGIPLPGGLNAPFETGRGTLSDLSEVLLAPLVLGAAGLVAALSLLGGVLSRYAPAVRAPLDVALDVDNYFREFPRKQIPRARIFARYVALLEHIAAQGYDKIVIVAHSQGCVISAETMRWLRQGRLGGTARTPARAALFEQLRGDVRLLTMGCPLRQLYAARFPTLYGWVLKTDGPFCGPQAEDIGVRQWLNAFTSGDYVGRWLWSRGGRPGDVLGHPLMDGLEPGFMGRASAYDAFVPSPPVVADLDPVGEAETCLGVGAHTHYFEPDQQEVAWMIDYLLGSRYTVTGGAPEGSAGSGAP